MRFICTKISFAIMYLVLAIGLIHKGGSRLGWCYASAQLATRRMAPLQGWHRPPTLFCPRTPLFHPPPPRRDRKESLIHWIHLANIGIGDRLYDASILYVKYCAPNVYFTKPTPIDIWTGAFRKNWMFVYKISKFCKKKENWFIDFVYVKKYFYLFIFQ